MNKSGKFLLGVVIGLLATSLSSLSRADVVFTLGNNPQPNEENLLLNTGATGSTVTGTTSPSGLQVNFTSATQLLNEPAGGIARIEATNGTSQVALSDVSFSLAGNGTFTDAIFNMSVNGAIGAAGGTATISVVANDGTSNFPMSLGNGANFLTVTTAGGELLSNISISSNIAFTDLESVRISGAAVPEPSTIALILGSLTIAPILIRRRIR